ncbi:hypothetical protein MAPG_05838 [Magnaporthiopsis poae ATCC 64411]|uniref:Uncharacterized protein n=1 Tax=Magnaporthiopsis poae (strain ATCC 64411 / 73-15) TaxID=644358 RepID=A0A0C4E0G4_MAGP6|nr:hypothetical protein MAPG_05838 [Magnaporthiopsis poae ATCC 64411]
MCIDRCPPSFRHVYADTGRHAGASRDDGVFNKATFRSRRNEDDGWGYEPDPIFFHLHYPRRQQQQRRGGGTRTRVVGSSVRKMVALYYLRQAEHLRVVLSQNQRAGTMSRTSKATCRPESAVLLGTATTDREAIRMQLGIPLEQLGLSSVPRGRVVDEPGVVVRRELALCRRRFLHLRFSELRGRVEYMNGAVTRAGLHREATGRPADGAAQHIAVL